MSSRELEFAPAARRDLRKIARHSRRTWGIAQAETYRSMLDEAFAQILDFPEIGPPAPGVGVNVRRSAVGQHIIYYVVLEERIVVARIVHERMSTPVVELP